MAEEIIIDDVDVSQCCNYDKDESLHCCGLTECEALPNCYYKQLQKEKQQHTDTKEFLRIILKNNKNLLAKIKYKEQECEKLKKENKILKQRKIVSHAKRFRK